MVIMRPKQSLKLDSVQISMKSRKGRRESELEKKEEENRYNAIDPFSNFGLLLPRLKAYIQVHKEETDQRDREHKKMNKPKTFGESHICIAMTLIVMLVTTLFLSQKSHYFFKDFDDLVDIEPKRFIQRKIYN